MEKKTVLFNNIRKYIKNIEMYNIITTSYLEDDYPIFLEKVYNHQSFITEQLVAEIDILSKELNLIINKMNVITSDIIKDRDELINIINQLSIKNQKQEYLINSFLSIRQ
jgi:hypothetical protein